MDIIYILITMLFFALTGALLKMCESLLGGGS